MQEMEREMRMQQSANEVSGNSHTLVRTGRVGANDDGIAFDPRIWCAGTAGWREAGFVSGWCMNGKNRLEPSFAVVAGGRMIVLYSLLTHALPHLSLPLLLMTTNSKHCPGAVNNLFHLT